MKIIEVENAQEQPCIISINNENIYIKIDSVFIYKEICVIGGWCSHEFIFDIEIDGNNAHLKYNDKICREDVNRFLNVNYGKFGFCCVSTGIINRCICLVIKNNYYNICAKINININNADFSVKEYMLGVFGQKIYSFISNIEIGKIESSIKCAIDNAIIYDDIIIISGWIYSSDKIDVFLTYNNVDILIDKIYYYPRHDIENLYGYSLNSGRHGFMAVLKNNLGYIKNINVSTMFGVQRINVANKDIGICESFNDFVKKVFSIDIPWTYLSLVYYNVLFESLQKLQRKKQEDMELIGLDEYYIGKIIKNPKVSIIIPVYGNINFVQTQILCFSEDDFIKKYSEIIYVIDDVKIFDEFRIKSEELYNIYNVPIRYVCGRCNRGFSSAKNLGASIAQGEYLIFINSDVFPEKTGWVEYIKKYLDNNIDVGIVGCRLLYPNGSIQHAGMKFLYRESLGIWTNVHPGIGCGPELDISEPSDMPAVTGACIALRREDFHSVNGWSTEYIIGDFEDSDLCFKIKELGKRIVYLPNISLIHLERQTFSLLGNEIYRQRLTIYNAVVHQIKWSKQLKENI